MRLTAPLTVLADHLGYDTGSPQAVVLAATVPVTRVTATLVGEDGTRVPLDVTGAPEQVDGWTTGRYLRIPFTAPAGTWQVLVGTDAGAAASAWFTVADELLASTTISDVCAYFRASRSSGEIDRKDRHARFYGDDSGREVDASGGWLDASGDFSKFLSHLTYTRTMSPQQIPLVAWACFAARDELARRHPVVGRAHGARLRDEGLFGCDFLLRFREPGGTFYTAIFDALTKNLEERVVNAPLQDSVRTQRWQAGFRQGGGLAVAALARAAAQDDPGTHAPEEYVDVAWSVFEHLEEHNLEYLFDGRESVLDDYCALLAAAELVAVLPDDDRRGRALGSLRRRVASLDDRYVAGADGAAGYLRADDEGRPFFHAAEAGLPVVALVRAAEVVATDERGVRDDAVVGRARALALRLARDLLARTDSVPNPFGYPRQLVQPTGGEPRESFFFPHDNETGYWWQGENAGICSSSYAASLVADLPETDATTAARLRVLATDQLHWVLGRNPFDSSMLQGRGRRHGVYSTVYQNLPGGILNGITAGFEDESDVDFLPAGQDAWRWAEQWIPHSGWYLLAVSAAG